MNRRSVLVGSAIAIGVAAVAACSSSSSTDNVDGDASTTTNEDAATVDTSTIDGGAASDGNMVVIDAGPDGGCFVTTVGVFGFCMPTTDCASLGDHVSTPGFCPGSASIECCTQAPNVADNPATPVGWKLMADADVTADMTTWAVTILHDPTMYPMFSTTTKSFPTLLVLARVEWHPPDSNNMTIHRGVTLYEPTD